MSPSRLLQLGSVVWAELEDVNGFRKVRPAVVASWQAEIAVGDVQQVVGILPPTAIGELLRKVLAALSPPRNPTSEPGDPAAGPVPDGSGAGTESV